MSDVADGNDANGANEGRLASEIVVLDDPQAVAEEAAARWLALATESIAERGRFMVALSGGSTPRTLYQRLAQAPFREEAPWADTHIFWGDERTVPPSHDDSNYRMAHEELLAQVAVPLDNIHRPRAEKSSQDAADDYEQIMRLTFDLRAGDFPRFDLILLGLGDDGHTASLFPGINALSETKRLFVSLYVDKLDTHRLTLTAPVINASRNVIFLAVGEGKADRLKDILEGDFDPTRLPAQVVRPQDGQLTWLLDEASAAGLS